MKYHRKNFHRKTFCEFQFLSAQNLPERTPDHISSSGSQYYFLDEGVIRISNHWGRAAACRWRLIGFDGKVAKQAPAGYAKWSDFYPYDPVQHWFYIRPDFSDIGHCLDVLYTSNLACFDEKEAVKRLKWLQSHSNIEDMEAYFDKEIDETVYNNLCKEMISSRLDFFKILKKYF